MNYDVSVGTDPELFGMKHGEFISVHDILPGTKQRPYRVTDGFVQVDGVAAEFNTYPAKTADEFLHNVRSVEREMQEMLGDVELQRVPTATFRKEYFDKLPPKVRELGCTPDFNALTGEENDPPSTTEPFRTGAGHFHFGWTSFADPNDPEHFDLCRKVVKQLDTVIFPISLQ